MLLTFNLAPKSSSDIFLRPSSGLVAPGAHQIFLVCTYPKGNAWKQHIFYLQFNFCPQYLKVGARVLGSGTQSGAFLFKATFWGWPLKLPYSDQGLLLFREVAERGKDPLATFVNSSPSGPCPSTSGDLGLEEGCRGPKEGVRVTKDWHLQVVEGVWSQARAPK